MNILIGLLMTPVFTAIGQKRNSEEQSLPSKRMKHDNNFNTATVEDLELLEFENSFNNLIDFNPEIEFGEDNNILLLDIIEEELTTYDDKCNQAQSFNLKDNLKVDYDNIQTNFINIEQKVHENDLKEMDDTLKRSIDFSNSKLYFLFINNEEESAGIEETCKDSNFIEHTLSENTNSQKIECHDNILEKLLNQVKLYSDISFEEELCSEDLKEVAVPINVTSEADLNNSIIDLTESISKEKTETNENINYKASFVDIENNLGSKSFESIFTEIPDDTNKYDRTNETLYQNIENFISKSVCKTQEKHYFYFLNRIKENISQLDIKNYSSMENKLMDIQKHEIICTKALDKLHNTFKTMTEIDFFCSLNRHLKSSETYNAIHEIISNFSVYQQNFIMHSEFIKFYDYLEEIPELLLVGINLPRYFSDNIFTIICLVNKFLENNKVNLKEHRNFVSLFIFRSFESFNMSDSIFLFGKTINTGCHKEHTSIFCFLMGVHEKIRSNLKKNNNNQNKSPIKLDTTAKKHLKIVVLLTLYQKLISMEYRNVDKKDIDEYRKFIYTIINSSKCPLCLSFKK